MALIHRGGAGVRWIARLFRPKDEKKDPLRVRLARVFVASGDRIALKIPPGGRNRIAVGANDSMPVEGVAASLLVPWQYQILNQVYGVAGSGRLHCATGSMAMRVTWARARG